MNAFIYAENILREYKLKTLTEYRIINKSIWIRRKLKTLMKVSKLPYCIIIITRLVKMVLRYFIQVNAIKSPDISGPQHYMWAIIVIIIKNHHHCHHNAINLKLKKVGGEGHFIFPAMPWSWGSWGGESLIVINI